MTPKARPGNSGDHPDRLSTFVSLSIPNFRRYVLGAAVSNNGTWMARIAQDWLIFQLTGSGLAVGIITALQFGPIFVLGLAGGMVADRFPQRRILLVTQASMLMLSASLAILAFANTLTEMHLYALALGMGIVTAFDNPARQSFVGVMVPPRLLPNAVALNSGNFHLARLTGPAIAGLLIAAVGAGWAFAFNAASFVAMIVAILGMNPADFQPAPRTSAGLSALRDGLAYVITHRHILLTLVLVFFIGTFGLNFPIFLTAYTVQIFTGNSALYGILNSVMAVGSVLGALVAARRANVTRQRLLVLAGSFSLLLMLLSYLTNLIPFGVALVAVGLAGVSFNATANASVQLAAAPEIRGRVMSIYFMIMMGTTPLGSLIVGWITDHWGAPAALRTAGALSLAAVAGCAWASRRITSP